MKFITLLVLSTAATALLIRRQATTSSATTIPQVAANDDLNDYIDQVLDDVIGPDNGTTLGNSSTTSSNGGISLIASGPLPPPTPVTASPFGDGLLGKRQVFSNEKVGVADNFYLQAWSDDRGNKMNVTLDLTDCGHGVMDPNSKIGDHIFRNGTTRAASGAEIIADVMSYAADETAALEDPYSAHTLANFELAQTKMQNAYNAGFNCSSAGSSDLVSEEQNIKDELRRKILALDNQDIVMYMVGFTAGGVIGAGLAVTMDAIFEANHTVTVKNPLQTGLAGALLGVIGYYVAHLRQQGTFERPSEIVQATRHAGAAANAVAGAAAATAAARTSDLSQRGRSRLRAQMAVMQNFIASQLNNIASLIEASTHAENPACEEAEVGLRTDAVPNLNELGMLGGQNAIDAIRSDIELAELGSC